MIQSLFIGTTELLLIGGMALLLFGGKKLPEMMRGLGQGVSEFKKGMKDMQPEIGLTEEIADCNEVMEADGTDKPKACESEEHPKEETND